MAITGTESRASRRKPETFVVMRFLIEGGGLAREEPIGGRFRAAQSCFRKTVMAANRKFKPRHDQNKRAQPEAER